MTVDEWQEWWKTFLKEQKLEGKIQDLNLLDRQNGHEAQTEKICFEVYTNYDKIKDDLEEVKTELINMLGQLEEVHLQSGRVKRKDSLIEKIIRKRYEYQVSQTSCYAHLNSQNYTDIITDLAGIRLIMNYRGKWKDIHNQILEKFPLREPDLYEKFEHLPHVEGEKFLAEIPIVYYAKGDSEEEYSQENLKTKEHKQGYRSIHYVISYKRCYVELQVRTIYDEAWSDCDHRYVYKHEAKPNNLALSKLSAILCKITNVANDIGDNMHDVFLYDKFSGADGDIWTASSEDIKFYNEMVAKLRVAEEELSAFVGRLNGNN